MIDKIYIKELDHLENYIGSGKLEEDFKYGDEETRYKILELLEKVMDVAEQADEIATRLIFRSSRSELKEYHAPDTDRSQ